MDRTRLDANIEAIRRYSAEHAELRLAHHFLYDLPLNKDAGPPEIVVMGINPGETEVDRRSCPPLAEETWSDDFHERGKRSQGSINWRRNAEFFANGKPVVFTELFFWSSNDRDELDARFGPLWESKHLRFCSDMNHRLLDAYRPKCVIFVGVGDSAKVARVFGLRHVRTFPKEGDRLVDHYEDDDRPWFFTKHWSGSFGFSRIQKEAIKDYLQQHL